MSCKDGTGCICDSGGCGPKQTIIRTDNTSVPNMFEEKARQLGVPLIPKRKDITPPIPCDPPLPNPVVAVCGECGLELHQVMGYVCSNPRCPTGLGPVMC